MTIPGTLESDLVASLDRRAQEIVIDPPDPVTLRAGVARPVPRVRRSPILAAASIIIVLGVAGAGFLVSRNKSQVVETVPASTPNATTVSTQTTLGEAETNTTDQSGSQLNPVESTPISPVLENPPHLLLEADGWQMSYFNDDSYPPAARSGTPQLFRAGSALIDPTIMIGVFDSDNPDVGWSAGDNAETIELNGRTIEVVADGTLPVSHVAGVTFDDGTLVIAQGYGLGRTEFLEAVRAVELPIKLPELRTLAEFVVVDLSESWTEQVIRREAQYDGPGGASAEIRTWSGTRSDIELQALDRVIEATSIRQGVIAGEPVVVAQHSDSRFFIVGGADGFVIEIDLQLGPDAQDDAMDLFLSSLRMVDRASFESVTPSNSVTSQTQEEVIVEMLADIPQPSDFDSSRLAATGVRYQVGAYVAGSVACAWIDQWVQAIEADDTERVREAADAMATSHQWAILLEMEPEGGYAQVVWEFADAITTSGTITGGGELGVEGFYQESLGCDS